MAFNMLDTSMIVPYPRENVIESDTILTWFDKVIYGRGKQAQADKRVVVDQEIYSSFLNKTLKANRSDFNSVCLEDGIDCMLFIYDT